MLENRSLRAAAWVHMLSALAAFALPAPAAAEDGSSQAAAYHWAPAPRLSLSGTGFLGVEVVDLTEDLREHFEVARDRGVLVGRVIEGGPAAGILEVGDILFEVESSPVTSPRKLVRLLARYKKDDSVPLAVMRDGERRDLSATLGDRGEMELPSLPKGFHFVPKIELQGMESEDWSELGSNISAYFSSPEWHESLDRLRNHRSNLTDRIHDLESRLRQMEGKLRGLEEGL